MIEKKGELSILHFLTGLLCLLGVEENLRSTCGQDDAQKAKEPSFGQSSTRIIKAAW